MDILGVAALVAPIWLRLWWLDPNLRRGRKFDKELATRKAESDADMVARSFATEDGASLVAAEVRLVFARHMAYPAEKLQLDDDLNFFWAELDAAELIQELESGFGISISEQDVEQTRCTIRDVSVLVASKTGGARASS